MANVEVIFTRTAWCNRCDRGFTGTSKKDQDAANAAAFAALEEHVVKHDDYVPELHSEIDE